jgi:hypothetical protein
MSIHLGSSLLYDHSYVACFTLRYRPLLIPRRWWYYRHEVSGSLLPSSYSSAMVLLPPRSERLPIALFLFLGDGGITTTK